MKVLVTGGSGFLGQHLKKEFSKYPELNVKYPTSSELNLLDQKIIWTLNSDEKPDVILHAAAVCGGIGINAKQPATFLYKNIEMGTNLYETARIINIKKIYTLGSVCAYPVNCPTPFKEDDIWNGYPESTNAPYGHAKRTLLMLGNSYREQHGIGGAHLIPVNLMGEHDNFNLKTSHVIPALIRKFDDAINNNHSPVNCWGTGAATREFLYAGDCAEAIVKSIVMNLDTPLPINLGIGQDISIYDLAHLIGKLMNFKGDIVFTGEVSDGQPRRRLDVNRAKELMNFTAKTSLTEGLEKTILWYRENKEEILNKEIK